MGFFLIKIKHSLVKLLNYHILIYRCPAFSKLDAVLVVVAVDSIFAPQKTFVALQVF